MLGHLFGPVNAAAPTLSGRLVQFDQGRYVPGGNPRGCGDWWGYQSAQYPLRSGPQLTAVVAMVNALGGPPN